ncbi:hypothetical protein HCEG_08633 [Histoplasma capsulatum var. duboisii H88]|uniref:Uncharacterized protein n=1 Tax=Ajellomyces capsulatus (strain H88) TaxID=544711 RepID=F0UU41_AJEC8|nr:hypothetical protein HCEG_08633 [Histoplasma capsulatum var. duboisii H88]
MYNTAPTLSFAGTRRLCAASEIGASYWLNRGLCKPLVTSCTISYGTLRYQYRQTSDDMRLSGRSSSKHPGTTTSIERKATTTGILDTAGAELNSPQPRPAAAEPHSPPATRSILSITAWRLAVPVGWLVCHFESAVVRHSPLLLQTSTSRISPRLPKPTNLINLAHCNLSLLFLLPSSSPSLLTKWKYSGRCSTKSAVPPSWEESAARLPISGVLRSSTIYFP